MTPAGNPASSATSATMTPAEIGANSDGLTTTVFPAATGEMTARQDRTLAPFHGVKLATTPSGRRTPTECVPGKLDSSTSPLGRNTQPATCWRVAATRSCWNVANEMVDPVSRASTSAISLRRSLTISEAFRNSALVQRAWFPPIPRRPWPPHPRQCAHPRENLPGRGQTACRYRFVALENLITFSFSPLTTSKIAILLHVHLCGLHNL